MAVFSAPLTFRILSPYETQSLGKGEAFGAASAALLAGILSRISPMFWRNGTIPPSENQRKRRSSPLLLTLKLFQVCPGPRFGMQLSYRPSLSITLFPLPFAPLSATCACDRRWSSSIASKFENFSLYRNMFILVGAASHAIRRRFWRVRSHRRLSHEDSQHFSVSGLGLVRTKRN